MNVTVIVQIQAACIENFMSDALVSIRARRAEIALAISLLQSEDDELATTEAVLQRFNGAGPTKSMTASRRAQRPRSQREYVLDVLASSDSPWLRSRDIARLAKGRWGVVIPEPSLRPLLSVMKQQKIIVRNGRLVALRERAFGAERHASHPEI